jgi:outer membrane lipoprotein-sorting protein
MITFNSFGQSQKEAEAFVQKVLDKVNAYENIHIDFQYILENTSEQIKQETKGDVTIAGEKYVLHLMGMTIMNDGKKVYTINPEDEEVTISNYDPDDEEEITPSKMLTFYDEGYNFEMDIVQNFSGRKIQFIKLTPIDTNAEIKEIYLGVDNQTYHVHNLIQILENGTRVEIRVKSFKTNQPLGPKTFEFSEKKYSSYYFNRLD